MDTKLLGVDLGAEEVEKVELEEVGEDEAVVKLRDHERLEYVWAAGIPTIFWELQTQLTVNVLVIDVGQNVRGMEHCMWEISSLFNSI